MQEGSPPSSFCSTGRSLASQLSQLPQPTYITTYDRINTWLDIESSTGPSLADRLKHKRKRSEPSVPNLTSPFSPTPLGRGYRRSASVPAETMSSMQPPVTPQKTQGSTGQVKLPPTPPSTSATKSSKDIFWASQSLKQNGMLPSDSRWKKEQPELYEKSKAIIGADRWSAMKAKSVEEAGLKWDYYEQQSEDTFLNNMLPCVISDGRRETQVMNPQNGTTCPIKTTWFSEGVRNAVNREFKRGTQPNRYGAAAVEAIKVLQKEDGMHNAKPDRCYGLDPDFFAAQDNGIRYSEDLRFWLLVMADMQHPFFLIEGKSNLGNIAEAGLQARRGGATLVHAHRQILSLIGTPDVQGVDQRTYTFSATVNPQLLEVYLHWAEVKEDGLVDYHYDYVDSFRWKHDEDVKGMRKCLHNILDWGHEERAIELRKLHEDMYAWQVAENEKRMGEDEHSPKKAKLGQ